MAKRRTTRRTLPRMAWLYAEVFGCTNATTHESPTPRINARNDRSEKGQPLCRSWALSVSRRLSPANQNKSACKDSTTPTQFQMSKSFRCDVRSLQKWHANPARMSWTPKSALQNPLCSKSKDPGQPFKGGRLAPTPVTETAKWAGISYSIVLLRHELKAIFLGCKNHWLVTPVSALAGSIALIKGPEWRTE